MPYLVGDLIKEITAGGPVPSFPKSFKGPPKLENEQEAVALDNKRSKAAQESQTTKLQEEPQEDRVKKKWERYYELIEEGELKPNFNKMTFLQFEQYMKDTQTQGRHKVCAVSRHMGVREQPAVQPELQQKEAMKTKATSGAPESSRKRKVVAPAAEPQTISTKAESRARKKPRVKAHITNEEYVRKH